MLRSFRLLGAWFDQKGKVKASLACSVSLNLLLFLTDSLFIREMSLKTGPSAYLPGQQKRVLALLAAELLGGSGADAAG